MSNNQKESNSSKRDEFKGKKSVLGSNKENVINFLKNWMTNISPKLQNIPIWKLTIPGMT
jgi:hypothetical protein